MRLPVQRGLVLSYGLFLKKKKHADYSVFFILKQVFKGEYRNCRGSLPEKCNIWQQVANELKNKYHSTINNTQQVNSTFQGNLQLSYRDLSPDYCVRNVTAGSPGLRGRVCGRKIRQCRSLCEQCGLTLGVEQRGSPGNCKDCPDIYSVTVCS